MNINKLSVGGKNYPWPLRNIPSPPQATYHSGASLNKLKALAMATTCWAKVS
jgi:predicted Rossmann fold nucleotide-binding protein DprA/Smf involved in DNA uptake